MTLRYSRYTHSIMTSSSENTLYFDRPDKDTWAMARLHHSLLLQIQDSPLWEREEVPDIPLSEAQMVDFTKGYNPGWEYRFAPYLLGGWSYITRSGFWLQKFTYQKQADGLYHLTNHYTTPKTKGHNLLAQVLIEGNFDTPILDNRLRAILSGIGLFQDGNK